MKEYPQGSTIRFLIKFKEDSNISINSFDNVNELYIFAFTNENNVIKFSKNVKQGFNTLQRVDSQNLLGILTESMTSNMLGDLYLEQKIKLLDVNNNEDVGVSKLIDTGVTIIESLISKNYDI